MSESNPFLVDGYERARVAVEGEIRETVLAEFATRLEEASLFKRFWLHREIRQEIERRIATIAPPDALY